MMAYLERHRRTVAIVLMFCLVLVNVYSFQGRAHAFVISGTLALGLALAAFILVAAGLVFANDDAADTAATAFYEDETEMIDSLLADGKVVYRPYEEEAEQFKFVAGIGAAAWQTVVDWVHANYVSGANLVSSEVETEYDYSKETYYIDVSAGVVNNKVSIFWNYQGNPSHPIENRFVFTPNGSSYTMRWTNYEYGTNIVYDCTYVGVTKFFIYPDGQFLSFDWYSNMWYSNGVTYSYVTGVTGVGYESYDSGIYANPETYANPLTGAHTVTAPLEATVLNPDLELDSGIGLKAGTPGAAVALEEPAVLDLPLTGVEEFPSTAVDNPADAVEDVTTADDAMAADETETSLRGLLLTKFPFCIPWDLMNAFKLLVAPPEAPYFEIDFLEPLDIDWQGSTTIVFDMAEYPMIGQVSRWVFTVEFCIVLAVGTRKIIRA